MFEQGDGTKLNDEVIGKLAKKFDVLLTETSDEPPAIPPVNTTAYMPGGSHGFCPNPHCPSNKAYEVDGRTLILPDMTAADPVGGKFCALCGEVLEKRCPNCGAPVHAGAICSLCGDPYVAVI